MTYLRAAGVLDQLTNKAAPCLSPWTLYPVSPQAGRISSRDEPRAIRTMGGMIAALEMSGLLTLRRLGRRDVAVRWTIASLS